MAELDYNFIMKDSSIRQSWLAYVMEKVEEKIKSNRRVPQKTMDDLRDKLSYYPVEDGVLVTRMPEIPKDKEVIFVGSAYMEDMIVAFGPNKNTSAENKYTLVITFKNRLASKIIHINREDLEYLFVRRGIKFSHDNIEKLPNGKIKVKIYENAKTFYTAVKNLDGEWLEQTPTLNGSFVPNRIIAKLTENALHIHAPQKNCKPFSRTFEIE